MFQREQNLEYEEPDSGFALAAVLWIILAVAAILTPLSINARNQTLHTAGLLQTDRLNVLAQGVAAVLISQYRNAVIEGAPSGTIRNSEAFTCKSGALLIGFQLQSHAGLVNVNTATEKQLTRVFRALGQSSVEAIKLAAGVSAHRAYSGKASSLADPLIRGGPKQAPLESVSELYDIEGMDRIDYSDLRSTFTVLANSNTIAMQATPNHLAPLSSGSDALRIVRWDNTALLASPVTVSVVVVRGIHRGQFQGIYTTRTSQNTLSHIAETWRYDSHELARTSGSEPDCTEYFGIQFQQALEAFG